MTSIAAKLTICYVACLLTTLLVAIVMGAQLIESRLIQASNSLVDSEFGRIRSHLTQGPPTTDAAVLEKRLRRLTDSSANLIWVEVRQRNGASLFLSRNLRSRHLPVAADKRYGTTIPYVGDVEISRYFIAPYYDVFVAISRHPVRTAMQSYIELFAGLVLVMAVVGVGSGYALSQISLGPLRSIRDTCARISLETLDARIPVPRVDDELSRLARLLNAMLDRLDASVREVRRFTSDASHELKTPLALMRLHLEKLGDDERLLDDQRATVDELARDMRHLHQIVESLLLLSRIDSHTLPVEMVARSPGAFLDDFCNDAQVLCEHRDCRFVLRQQGEGTAVFDARWIRQVLFNLLSNAIRTSPRGGVITLESRLAPDGWTVTLHDEGSGLAEDQHERIFERFVSGDENGSGLGLPICRSIIALHGGTIRAAHGVGGRGLQVSFHLPTDEGDRILRAGPSIASLTARRGSPASARPDLQAAS